MIGTAYLDDRVAEFRGANRVLIALVARNEERITLDFDPLPRGRARIVAHGRAPRRVRQAFAELVA